MSLKPKLSVILAACLLLFSCKMMKSTFGNERKNIICYIDMSKSVPRATLDQYIKGVKGVLENCDVYDRFVLYPIDDGAFEATERILDIDFQKAQTYNELPFSEVMDALPPAQRDSISPPFARANDGEVRRTAKRRARVKGYIDVISSHIKDEIIRHRKTRVKKGYGEFTDLIYGLLGAKNLLDEDSDDFSFDGDNINVKNYIIIFSDMIQESKTGYNFNKGYGVLRTEGDIILKNLKRDNRIPDLKEAKIIIIGRATAGNVQTQDAMINVENFWESYFSKNYANGAVPITYSGVDGTADLKDLLTEKKK